MKVDLCMCVFFLLLFLLTFAPSDAHELFLAASGALGGGMLVMLHVWLARVRADLRYHSAVLGQSNEGRRPSCRHPRTLLGQAIRPSRCQRVRALLRPMHVDVGQRPCSVGLD